METLETLVKLAQSHVEDKQKVVAEYRGQIAELNSKIESMEQKIVAEQQQAADNPELMQMLQNFIQHGRRQIELWQADVSKLEEELAPHLDELSELFAEQKRMEIMLERAQQKALEERKKKEQGDLDEVGINRHFRKPTS